jgi:hypothetical protein
MVRRISTNIYAAQSDLTKGLKIKSSNILTATDVMIGMCRSVCNDLGYTLYNMDIDALVVRLKNKLSGKSTFGLDIFEYGFAKAKEMKPATASLYVTMLNCLKRYVKRDTLDILEINGDFLKGFKKFIENEPSQAGKQGVNKPAKGHCRAVSSYLERLRSIYNMAKEDYNKEDLGIINIPYSPFKYF